MTDGFYGDSEIRAKDERPRCVGCNKLLAESVSRPWAIRCTRCKQLNCGELTNQEPFAVPSTQN